MNRLSTKEQNWFNMLTPQSVANTLVGAGWKLCDNKDLPPYLSHLQSWWLKAPHGEDGVIIPSEHHGDWQRRLAEVVDAVAIATDLSVFEVLRILAMGKDASDFTDEIRIINQWHEGFIARRDRPDENGVCGTGDTAVDTLLSLLNQELEKEIGQSVEPEVLFRKLDQAFARIDCLDRDYEFMDAIGEGESWKRNAQQARQECDRLYEMLSKEQRNHYHHERS